MSNRHTARAPRRPESRDVVELNALRVRSPELAPAVDLQLATLDLFRRAQARVPLPPQLDLDRFEAALASGRAVLRFADVPFEWSDYRWVLRETADLLRRFDLVDAPSHAALLAVTRDGNALEPQVRAWFAAATTGDAAPRNLTGALGVSFEDETWDTPEPSRPYGVAGWTGGDASVLLYDRYDVWEVTPDGTAAPRMVTAGQGRQARRACR